MFSYNVLPQIGHVAENLVAIDAIETATKMNIEAMEYTLKDRVEGSLTIKTLGLSCKNVSLKTREMNKDFFLPGIPNDKLETSLLNIAMSH